MEVAGAEHAGPGVAAGPGDLQNAFPLRPPDRGLPTIGRNAVSMHSHNLPPGIPRAERLQMASRREIEREVEVGKAVERGF